MCQDRCQDTYRPPLRLGAGRLCGLLADAGLLADGLAGGGGWLEAYAAGWRLLAFLGAGEARREGRRRWWCCRWRSGRRGDGLPVVACWVAAGGLPVVAWAAAICGGNSAVFNRLLNIFPYAFAVCGCFVFVLCRSAIPAGAAWPMMTGGPRPGCAAAAPGPGCSRQAGRQVLGGGVAEKAAASLGMGGEYSHILPRTLPGYRKTWRRVLWNPGRKLSGAYSWLSKISSFY